MRSSLIYDISKRRADYVSCLEKAANLAERETPLDDGEKKNFRDLFAILQQDTRSAQLLTSKERTLFSLVSAFSGDTLAGQTSDFLSSNNSRIVLMKQTSTWASGYHALRDACETEAREGSTIVHPSFILGDKTIYRPLTLGEDLRARIIDARAHNNVAADSPSWSRWNDSCTAIVYGSNGRFKVQKISPDLLRLRRDFNEPFVRVDYDGIRGTDVCEFDRKDAKYNEALTQDEVLRHPFWLFVANNDTTLCDYTQLQWSGKTHNYKGMGIWLRDQSQRGELRALFVDDHNYVSGAYGDISLNNGGGFLQVSS